jgi:hypothetical protein
VWPPSCRIEWRVTLTAGGERDGEMIFARVTPEKVKVTETYEVEQVISVNPRRTPGRLHSGQIKITVPYDGLRYFTRQAARDVQHARSGTRAAPDPDATIGHLVLAEHDQIETLPAGVRMRAEYGVLPVAVPLPGSAELIAGRSASEITHEYQPKYPQIVPAELEIDVLDPDSVDYMSLAEALADDNPEDTAHYAKIIGGIRQNISFQNTLMMRVTVRLSLPLDQERPNFPASLPVVRRLSIDWPTITSLRTTELEVYGTVLRDGQQVTDAGWQRFPVRYNPVDRRIEWEVVQMVKAEENADGGRARTIDYESLPMRLLIRHPGELYRTPKLKLRAQIEVPGYLMSGLDPRLFCAFGSELPRINEIGRDPLPTLTTRVDIDGTLVVDDAFARRYFSPHHNIIFDDVIPDPMRVNDIKIVLKSLGFSPVTDVWEDLATADAPQWFLRAERKRGPDQMDLWIYVDGSRHTVEQQQIEGDSNVKTTKTGISGQIRLHMLGRLPRDHQEMTREMNALERALRDRYQYHRVSRR